MTLQQIPISKKRDKDYMLYCRGDLMAKPQGRKPTDDESIEDADELDMEEEEVEEEMKEGKLEPDVYSKAGRELELEDDEISDVEEGFSSGADDGGSGAKCRKCGKILMGPKSIVEKKISGKWMEFCSNRCVELYEKERE